MLVNASVGSTNAFDVAFDAGIASFSSTNAFSATRGGSRLTCVEPVILIGSGVGSISTTGLGVGLGRAAGFGACGGALTCSTG